MHLFISFEFVNWIQTDCISFCFAVGIFFLKKQKKMKMRKMSDATSTKELSKISNQPINMGCNLWTIHCTQNSFCINIWIAYTYTTISKTAGRKMLAPLSFCAHACVQVYLHAKSYFFSSLFFVALLMYFRDFLCPI